MDEFFLNKLVILEIEFCKNVYTEKIKLKKSHMIKDVSTFDSLNLP